MQEKLTSLITPNNLLSYSNGCYEVGNLLFELSKQGYKRLIIPSRGAYPFYEGALTALRFLIGAWETHLLRIKYNLWLLPYTSDWGSSEIGLTSGQVRKFWSKILADTIRREKTPFTQFYGDLVSIAGERLTINTSELTLDKFYKQDTDESERFVFIDTAISGKAICEIIDAFNDLNLNDFMIIMIADNGGRSIDSRFKNTIEREKSQGRLVQINVDNIYSEDASPLLNTGISSIVFPSLIEAAFSEISEFQSGGFSGGGIWFIDATAELRETNPIINGIQGIMSSLLHMGIRQVINSQYDEWFEPLVLGHVTQIYENATEKKFDIFDPSSTKQLVYDRLIRRSAPTNDIADVAPSHVVRVNLENKIIGDIIHKAKIS